MAQDRRKEDLKKLLAFLQNIIREPENSWFVDELYSILPSKRDDTRSLVKIEKYLGLDYNIDKFVPLIDFSFVADEYVKECFKADYRQMLRCRFGTRNHEPEFSEYCRYVMLIIERAINYYFSCYDFDVVKSEMIEIEKSQPKIQKTIEDAKTLAEISLAIKLYCFCTVHNMWHINNFFKSVRNVRNQQSHGQIESVDKPSWFKETQNRYIRNGYPIRFDGLVDLIELQKSNPTLLNVFNNTIRKSDEYERYIQLAWELSEPFDEINLRLRELISFIAATLNT